MTDPIDAVIALAVEQLDAFLKTSDTANVEISGMVEPTAEEFAAYLFEMQKLWPPQTFGYPDGRTVTASPWILALGQCENGDEWLDKFNRFIERNGGGL